MLKFKDLKKRNSLTKEILNFLYSMKIHLNVEPRQMEKSYYRIAKN